MRACFAYMVFPVLLVCNLVSYSEPIFLTFTLGAYYYWKREKFGYAALLAVFSIFTRQVGAFIVVIFLVDMLYMCFSHRERSRVIRELAVIAITCAGVAMLYLFYLYRFGNPFIVSSVEALNWKGTLSVANLFNNVGTHGFQTPARCHLTTPLCLFSWSTPFWWWRPFWRSSRGIWRSQRIHSSHWPNATACPAINSLSFR
jgi:hypothetical protein